MEEFNIYDEDNALEYIRKSLPEEVSAKYDDDEILFIIDCIRDYYDDNGLLSLSDISDEEDTADIEAIASYTAKAIKKAGIEMRDVNELPLIIKAEIEYEDSLEELD